MVEQRSGIKVTASDALEFEPVSPRIKRAGSVLKTVAFVVLAIGGGAAGWAFYGDRIVSLMGDADADVPIVRAELGPVKVRPASPGGMQVPDRDKLVYNRIQGSGNEGGAAPSVERLLPPPETPMPKPEAASEVAPPSPSTTADTENTIPIPPAKPKRIDETPRVADVTRAEKPVPAPPAPPVPAVTKTASATPLPKSPVVAPKVPKKAVVAPRTVTSSTAKAATSAARSLSSTPVLGKAFQVQLAAARTPAAARSEWDKLRRKHLDLLGNLGLAVTKVDLGAKKGVFYRLRVGPIKAEAEARTLCKALAKRKVSCLIVRPGK